MPVVFATNLTHPATRAVNAAAALAERLEEPLWLLGVEDVEHPAPEAPFSFSEARARLEAEAARLRASSRVPVETRMREGSPVQLLTEDEDCQRARLLVLSAEGWGPASAWHRPPVYERVAQHSRVPVLVVRGEGEVLVDWARGRRRLVVLAGVDDSPPGEAAAAWLPELRRVGPCDVVAAYVCSPPEARERLGLHPLTPEELERLEPGARGMEAWEPEVERVLLRELRERVGELPGEGVLEPHLEPGFGRPADHLLHLARERGVDLVVVGTHQRGGLARLWHGSVSAGVLRHAEQSVVCVPSASP